MNLYDIDVRTITGETTKLSAWTGKVMLIVNTASGCGLTPQFEGLEALYRRFNDRGLVVLGFPCNQFAGQEPLDDKGIQAFCTSRYDVSFPMFAKLDVNGAGTHPLYAHLKQSAPGVLGSEAIKWNFTKFLVDQRGAVVARFGPKEEPAAIAGSIEEVLEGRALKAGAVSGRWASMLGPSAPLSMAHTVARVLLGGVLLLAGATHLTVLRQEFLAQVPKWVPLDADFVVLASGVVEVLLGASLVFLSKRRALVGLSVAAFFIAIFPGNISQYMNGISAFGLDTDRARFIRLFFQPVLVLWALWSTGAWRALRTKPTAAGVAPPAGALVTEQVS